MVVWTPAIRKKAGTLTGEVSPLSNHRSEAQGSTCVALTPGFNLTFVEELEGLLVQLLLSRGVLAAFKAFILVVDSYLHLCAPSWMPCQKTLA